MINLVTRTSLCALLGVIVLASSASLAVTLAGTVDGSGPVTESLQRYAVTVWMAPGKSGRLTVDLPPAWEAKRTMEPAGTYNEPVLKIVVIGPDGMRVELLPTLGYGETVKSLYDFAVQDLKKREYRQLAQEDWSVKDERGRNRGGARLYDVSEPPSTVLSGALQVRNLTIVVRSDQFEASRFLPIVEALKTIRVHTD